MNDSVYPFEHISIFKTDKYNNKYFYGIGSSGCVKDNKTFYYIIDNGNITKKEIEFDRDLFNEIIYSIDYPDKDNISNIFFNNK